MDKIKQNLPDNLYLLKIGMEHDNAGVIAELRGFKAKDEVTEPSSAQEVIDWAGKQ